MIKIGFTGVPGSGKTSTARALVAKLRSTNSFKNIELIQEYARKYIREHGQIEELWEQFRVISKQIEWEDNLVTSKLDLIVTDSPVFLGFLYAIELQKKTKKDVMVLNDIFKMLAYLNFPEKRYDFIFHLSPKITALDDGVRSAIHLDQKWRDNANTIILASLNIFPPKKYVELKSTNTDERVDECLNILNLHWGTHAKN